MKIGASTKAFGGKSSREVAELFAKCALGTAELCFCQSDLSGFRYNLCGSAALPSADDAGKAVEAFKVCGIDVCAIGVYLNFWSGKDSEIYDTLGLFCEYCDMAASLGVRTLTTHTGSVFALSASRGFDKRLYEKLCHGFVYASVEAHKRGLTIGVEFGDTDAVKSYSEFLKLKEYANGIAGTDTLKCISSPCVQNEEIPLSQIALCHIKDRKHGSKFYERYGAGDTSFDAFFSESEKYSHIPMILEYVNSENLGDTARRFLAATAEKD